MIWKLKCYFLWNGKMFPKVSKHAVSNCFLLQLPLAQGGLVEGCLCANPYLCE